MTVCQAHQQDRTYLPIDRWTNFDLDVVDNADFIKTRLFMSMIASLAFQGASLIWQLLSTFFGFSYGFDMICTAATPVNNAAATISQYAAFFIIPAFLVVMAGVIRRWNSGGRGPAQAMRMLIAFAIGAGGIFFLADQANQNRNDPTAAYGPVWMAATAQKTFNDIGGSLDQLGTLTTGTGQQSWGFYDNNPALMGNSTCVGVDNTLYKLYQDSNKDLAGGSAAAAMAQVSRSWEIAFVRPWIAAQFGTGYTGDGGLPSHPACRDLEMRSSVDNANKRLVFDQASGLPAGATSAASARGRLLNAMGDDKQQRKAVILWGACEMDSTDASHFKAVGPWAGVKAGDGDRSADDECNKNLSSHQEGYKTTDLAGGTGDGGNLGNGGTFYFNGDDELNNAFGCLNSSPPCTGAHEFVTSYLGRNEGTRITQGFMALITAIVFLFALGPMAIGLMVVSIALAFLVVISAVTLLLIAMGKQSGMRLAKLTGAAAAGDLVFTLMLTALMTFIYMTFQAIQATVGTSGTPGFFEQVLMAGSPIVALIVARRLASSLGLGNITSMSGALGFVGAAAMKATGDQSVSHRAAERVSSAIGGIGFGKRRLSGLDERSLQRRMIDNRATRSLASATGRAARRKAAPVGDVAKRGWAHTGRIATGAWSGLRAKAASGSPAQRAAAFAGMAAAATGASALLPGALPLAALAAAGASGAAFTRNGARGLRRFVRTGGFTPSGEPGAYDPDTVAGFELSRRARTAARQAQDWSRTLAGTAGTPQRAAMQHRHTTEALELVRAREFGAGSDKGLNAEFAGFAHSGETLHALERFAETTGIPAEQLLAGSHGIVLPTPVTRTLGRPTFTKYTTVEQAAHPVHWLDKETLKRQVMADGRPEDDDHYTVRLVAQLRERGAVDEAGQFVDVFRANGLDTRDARVRDRIEAFIQGAKDEELGKITIAPQHNEQAAIRVAYQWAEEATPSGARLEAALTQEYAAQLSVARREIADFRAGSLELSSGASATTGQAYDALKARMSAMTAVMGRVQQLQTDPPDDPADAAEARARAAAEQTALANAIDQLAGLVRDAADASANARRFLSVDMEATRPGHPRDASDLAAIAQQLERETAKAAYQRHQELDKLVGSLFVTATGARDAEALEERVDQLRVMVQGIVATEEQANAALLEELTARQAAAQARAQAQATDPRRSQNTRALSTRQILQDQRDTQASQKSNADVAN